MQCRARALLALLGLIALPGCGGSSPYYQGPPARELGALVLPTPGPLTVCCESGPAPALPLLAGEIKLRPLATENVRLLAWWEPQGDEPEFLALYYSEKAVSPGFRLRDTSTEAYDSFVVEVFVTQCFEGTKYVRIRTETVHSDELGDPLDAVPLVETFAIPVTATCAPPPMENVWPVEGNAPEGMGVVVGPQLGLAAGQVGAIVFSASGWEIVDLATGTQLSREGIAQGGSSWGGAVLASPASPTNDAVVSGGPLSLGTFGWNSIFGIGRSLDFGNFTDCHAVGDGTAALCVNYTKPAIEVVEWSASLNRFDLGLRSIQASAFPADERPVCAAARSRTDTIWIVAEKTSTGRATVHFHVSGAAPTDPPAYVGLGGLNPRRTAYVGDVLAFTNFGSDSVTLVRTDVPAVVDEAPVGAEPLGIAGRDNGDGTATFVVACFGDDAIHQVHVDLATGLVLSSGLWRQAPSTVQGTGHVVYSPDFQGLVVTANTSNNLWVLDAP